VAQANLRRWILDDQQFSVKKNYSSGTAFPGFFKFIFRNAKFKIKLQVTEITYKIGSRFLPLIVV
jgi:hypothetical protein